MQLKVMQSLRLIRWVLHIKTDENLNTLKERNSVPFTEGQQSLSVLVTEYFEAAFRNVEDSQLLTV